MTAKDRHRKNLIEYLGDWDNPFTSKKGLAEALGIKRRTLYFHFTPAELNEIMDEGLELRKKQSSAQRSEIYDAMRKSAVDGNATSQKEFLDRTEGKVIEKVENTLKADQSMMKLAMEVYSNRETK